MLLPEQFVVGMKGILPLHEYHAFITSLHAPTPVSVRFHPGKCPEPALDEETPCCPLGRYLPVRPVFTLDPSFHAGAYYVQEASSMALWCALEQVSGIKKGLRILDLCAAPGGKTTLMADFYGEESLIVANEIHRGRVHVLRDNVIKSGYANILISNNTAADLGKCIGFFDLILVDAPCSGEGMFRKDPNACTEWSPEAVQACSVRQQDILRSILPALKENGVLLYSTCTYNTIENEGTLEFLASTKQLESIPLNMPPNATERKSPSATGYQFYPHKMRGEGFFISAFKKITKEPAQQIRKFTSKLQISNKKTKEQLRAQWCADGPVNMITDIAENNHLLIESFTEEALFLSSLLRLMHCGVNAGTFRKDVFIPHHNLALSHWVHPATPRILVNREEALKYLKKEQFSAETQKNGWHLITYIGNHLEELEVKQKGKEIGKFNLGWAKNIGTRINNYLPGEFRIRMQIPEF